MITSNGGRVRVALPGKTKGRSTKKYIILYNPAAKSKPLAAIREAVRKGYPVIHYNFIFDSVSKEQRQPISVHQLDTFKLVNRISKELPLRRHLR